MKPYRYLMPTEVVFAPGALDALAEKCKAIGTKPLLVTGTHAARATGTLERLCTQFPNAALFDAVQENPTTLTCEDGARRCRERRPDRRRRMSQVVGLGLAVVAPSDTMNLRTLAVLPGHHGYGLGQAIAAEIYQRAIADGQKFVHHCQMSPVTPPQRWDGGRAQVTREYSMFERGIG